MKKLATLCALSLTLGAAAQSIQPTVATAAEKLSPKQLEAVKARSERMKAAAQSSASKTAGGPIDQLMSHYEGAIDLYGLADDGGPLTFYIAPTFIDSTVVDDFGTIEPVSTHGVGATLDPTSDIFGVSAIPYFSMADAYTVDTVYIQGVYDIITPGLSGNTGDKLRFEIIYGPSNSNTVFRTGIYYPSGTFPGQTDDIDLLPMRYTGSPNHGDAGGLTWANKVVIEYDLTTDDSSGVVFAIPAQVAVPAGNVFGVAVSFIPGYTWNPGDMYFSGAGGASTAVINSFRAFQLAADDANDDYPYFLEPFTIDPDSRAMPQGLFTDTRYAKWSGTTDRKSVV